MTFNTLFIPAPRRFGLRGDPYLWDAMRRLLETRTLPGNERDLIDTLNAAFTKITCQPLDSREDIFVQALAHGGMSSGMVDVNFWQKTAVPMLVRRFRRATLKAKRLHPSVQGIHPESESIAWLIEAIRQLPTDPPVATGTPGYNTYTTQRGHWLGWLDPSAGTGTYPRRTGADCDARRVYNRIVEPKLLLWLVSAAEVAPELIEAALRDAESEPKLAGKSRSIRRQVPWHVVEQALKRRQGSAV